MKTLVLSLLLQLVFGSVFAQYDDWVSYYEASRIYSIAQDDNYIWAGSSVGALKINKNSGEVTHFNKQNSPLNYITEIVIDNYGVKWFGTVGGSIFRYDDTDWIVYNSGNSLLPNSSIQQIAVGDDNSLWIVAGYSGLIRFDGAEWSVYNTSNSPLPSDLVSSVFFNNGILWVATYGGLVKYDGVNWTIYVSPNTVGISTVMEMDQDSQGNIWLLHNTAVEKFDGDNFTLFSRNNTNLPDVQLTSMTIDLSDNIWTSSMKEGGLYSPIGGIHRFSGSNWIKYDTLNSGLNDTHIYQIMADTDNNIWFGNSIGHIGKKEGLTWTYYDASIAKLDNSEVRHIITDINGYAYIGTKNPKLSGSSLYKFNMDNWTPMPYYSVLSHTMATDNQADLYIKNQNGIKKFNGSNWIDIPNCPYISSSGTPYSTPDEMVINDQGHIWIDYCDSIVSMYDPDWGYYYSTYNGVAQFDGSSWTKFNIRNSQLPSGGISDIKLDAHQNIFISTYGGLVKISNSVWTIYNTTNSSLPYNHIGDFAIDSLGHIWFSDSHFGLNEFDFTSTTHYPHPTLSQYSGGGNVVIDTDGSIWQRTLSELIRFDGTDWTAFSSGNSPLCVYNVNSLEIDKYGNKWIGTPAGFFIYKEGGVITSTQTTPLTTEKISIFPNPCSYHFNLVLDREYENITVSLVNGLSSEVYAGNFKHTDRITIPTNNLKTGVYFLKVTSVDKAIGCLKVVVVH